MAQHHSNCPQLINYPDRNYVYPLYKACMNGHVKCVRFLLENGADPNLTSSAQKFDNINNPLSDVIYKADNLTSDILKIIHLLLIFGAHPNIMVFREENQGSDIPLLIYAINKNCDELFYMLLEHGSDPNTTFVALPNTEANMLDDHNCPCIAFAVLSGKCKMVQYLLKFGARVEISALQRSFMTCWAYFPFALKNYSVVRTLLLYGGITLEQLNLCIAISFLTYRYTMSQIKRYSPRYLNTLHKFGFNFSIHSLNCEQCSNNDPDSPVLNEMLPFRSNTLSLKCLSRLAILKSMGRMYMYNLSQLEVPDTLYSFLQFEDVF
jgi:hypothetical protein